MLCLECGKPTFTDFDTLGYEVEICPYCGAQHDIDDYIAPLWTPAAPPPADPLALLMREWYGENE